MDLSRERAVTGGFPWSLWMKSTRQGIVALFLVATLTKIAPSICAPGPFQEEQISGLLAFAEYWVKERRAICEPKVKSMKAIKWPEH